MQSFQANKNTLAKGPADDKLVEKSSFEPQSEDFFCAETPGEPDTVSAHGTYDQTHIVDEDFLHNPGNSDILETLSYNFTEHVITVR
jgi:hypothetical protein